MAEGIESWRCYYLLQMTKGWWCYYILMLQFYTVPINTGCPTPSSAVPAKTEGVLVMSADLHNIYFLPDKVLIIFKRSDFKDGLRMEFNRYEKSIAHSEQCFLGRGFSSYGQF